MRFDKPIKALRFWWTVLQAGGVPIADAVYEYEEGEKEYIQTSRKRWTPSDLLCTYHDIGIALEKLSSRDQDIIKSYLLDFVGYTTDNGTRTATTGWAAWKHKEEWRHIMRRLWSLIPGEYKYYEPKRKRQSADSKRDSVLPRRTRRHHLSPTPHREVKGIQGSYPVAGMAL